MFLLTFKPEGKRKCNVADRKRERKRRKPACNCESLSLDMHSINARSGSSGGSCEYEKAELAAVVATKEAVFPGESKQ
jgi:hypothetical protein